MMGLHARDIQPFHDRVSRSAQVDTGTLDDELLGLFKDILNKCLGIFHSEFMARHYREIMVGIRTAIFGLTVARGKPTPGMAMLNLDYRNERSAAPAESNAPFLTKNQRILLYIGDILGPYAWSKVAMKMMQQTDQSTLTGSPHIDNARMSLRSVWFCLNVLHRCWIVSEFVNFSVYLRHGRYRRLWERVVGCRLVYTQLGAPRHISFDYLNRQLIWSEISDLILFFLPLLNLDSVRSMLHEYFPATHVPSIGSSPTASPGCCSLCRSASGRSIHCRIFPCRHEYCYFCIASMLSARKKHPVRCSTCSEEVQSVSMIK
jgi:peroxin-2